MKRLLVAVAAIVLLAACQPRLITDPGDGAIVASGPMPVSGSIPDDLPPGGTLTVNGVPTPINADGTWSTEITAGPDGDVNVIEAIYTDPAGEEHRQRTATVSGPKLEPGEYSSPGVGMHFTTEGLSSLGPIVTDIAREQLDISETILSQHPLIPETLAVYPVFYSATAYQAGNGDVSVDVYPNMDTITTEIVIEDFYLGLNVEFSPGPGCGLEIEVPDIRIYADLDLEPSTSDASYVDVIQRSLEIYMEPVNWEWVRGCFDRPALQAAMDAFKASLDVQNALRDAFAQELVDVDGAGGWDPLIPQAIEDALAGISIAGSIGDAVQAHLDAPIDSIEETGGGMNLRASVDFYAALDICDAPSGAPVLPNTYDTPGAYEYSLPYTTPSNHPYDMGLSISSSAFNQMLGAMVECGLLNQDITQFAGIPITSTFLGKLIRAFDPMPPSEPPLPDHTPMLIRIDPVFSPYLTTRTGPNGEQAELMLADLRVSFVEPRADGDVTWLTLAVDAPLGFELAFDPAAGALAPTITPPVAGSVEARVLDNKVGADEDAVENVFAGLFPMFVSGLSDGFAAFPLPDLLGLDLDVVEIERLGSTFVLYLDLNPSPATRLENVVIKDRSESDYANDAIGTSWEWRHRLRKKTTSTSVDLQLAASITVDEATAAGNEDETGEVRVRAEFDVVPEPGRGWQLDMDQHIRGAYTIVDDNHAGRASIPPWIDCWYQVNPGTRAADGTWTYAPGPWDKFSINVVPASTGNQTGYYNQGIESDWGERSITGQVRSRVTVECPFILQVWSWSQFGHFGGNEASIRLGLNGTLSRNVTSEDYVEHHPRDIAEDGFFFSAEVHPIDL